MNPIGSVYLRRRGARGVLSAAALALAASCSREERPADRPLNVLLISLDSLRPDHLGCYGYRSPTGAPTSPRLDRLAREGVLFEHAVSTTSWTMPSHHALFCGLVDLLHGAISNDAGATPIRVQLAKVLAEAGCATAGFFSGPYLTPRYGFGDGFSTWENASGVREELGELVPAATPAPGGAAPDVAHATAELEVSYERASSARRVSDAGLAWLDGHRREHPEQPFFLFLHYFDVHYDYVPPDEGDARRFWPEGRRPRLSGEDFFHDPRIAPGMSAEDLAGVVSSYDGEIAWTDGQVGRVLDRLEALQLADDTLVVVVSDHGDEFFEHGAKGHRQNLFGSTLDIALIARLPRRLPTGRRIAQRVSIVDVAPTILDLAGALDRAGEGLDAAGLAHGMWGRTLVPLIEGSEQTDRDCIGFLANRWQDVDHPIDHWALWTGGIKVMVTHRYEWIHGAGGERVGLRTIERTGELFDLAADPAELRPLDDPSHPGALAAIDRFDAVFAQEGDLARLMRRLPAGVAPQFSTPQERAAEERRLAQLGYTLGPSGSLPPPPQFPRPR